MISKKLSLNKVCIILATTILLLSVVMFSVLYILTKEMSVVFCSMAFGLLFLLFDSVYQYPQTGQKGIKSISHGGNSLYGAG